MKLKIISGLLAPFPQAAGGDPQDVLMAHIAALEDIPVMFIGAAAGNFNRGTVAGYNPSFAPTPPAISKEARRLWAKELDERNYRQKLKQQDALPQIERTTEDVSHRKAAVDRILGQSKLGTMRKSNGPDYS